MPAVGNASNFNARLPPPPKPAPTRTAPPPDVPHGAGTLSTGRPAAVRPASAYTAPAPKTVVPQALPHGSGTLTKVTPGATRPASAYNIGQPYAKTVLQVFRSQALPQQKAIVAGALKNPHIPESQIVLNFLKGAGNYADMVVPNHSQNVLAPLGDELAKLGHLSLQAVYGGGNAGKGMPTAAITER